MTAAWVGGDGATTMTSNETVTLRFDAASLRQLLADHYPDFRNFEMSLRCEGYLFCLAEHEVLLDGTDGYAILYTFYQEDGRYHFVQTYEQPSYPPRHTKLWEEKVGARNFRRDGAERILGRVRVEDLNEAVRRVPSDTKEITLTMAASELRLGATGATGAADADHGAVALRLVDGVYEL